MSTDPTPEAIEELRKILADHWAAGMARSGAPAEWECVCDVALEMSDEAHQAHTAREVLAAGWISPLVHSARAAAWLVRFEKAEATTARLRTLLAAWEDAARQVEATEPNTAEWFRFSALAVRNALADPVTTDHAAQKLAEMRDLRGISTTEHEETE
jgi:hypothetical protein